MIPILLDIILYSQLTALPPRTKLLVPRQKKSSGRYTAAEVCPNNNASYHNKVYSPIPFTGNTILFILHSSTIADCMHCSIYK